MTARTAERVAIDDLDELLRIDKRIDAAEAELGAVESTEPGNTRRTRAPWWTGWTRRWLASCQSPFLAGGSTLQVFGWLVRGRRPNSFFTAHQCAGNGRP